MDKFASDPVHFFQIGYILHRDCKAHLVYRRKLCISNRERSVSEICARFFSDAVVRLTSLRSQSPTRCAFLRLFSTASTTSSVLSGGEIYPLNPRPKLTLINSGFAFSL